MHIIFSRHASEKLEQRRIPRQIVIGVVRFPDLRVPGRGVREELYKRFRGIYLKVVIRQRGETIVVITAHLVARVKKQW